MTTYIANFGVNNIYWPICASENVITLQTSVECFEHWKNDDRLGWISWATHNLSSLRGRTATPPVASRWFNLLSIFFNTSSDLWLHRHEDELFWTRSRPGAPTVTEINDGRHVLVRRPADSWSSRNVKGRPLLWKAIHPKARDFLHTEATYQELATDRGYRQYANALVEGAPFEPWHDQPNWKTKLGKSSPVKVFTNLEKTIWRAVKTVERTVAFADGSLDERVRKIKNLTVSAIELREYLEELYRDQEGLCAATGLEMLLDDDEGSEEFRLSVDRIDSDGDYDPSNLQLLCQFANFWKGNSNDTRFKELIAILKADGGR
jgi:hypothetical protein